MGGGAGTIGTGMGNSMPHSTMQYPSILGEGLDPMVMSQMDGGHPTVFLSVGGLPAHLMTQIIGGAGGVGGNLSMGRSNHESFASSRTAAIPQQIFGNEEDGGSKRLSNMPSSDTQEMSRRG